MKSAWWKTVFKYGIGLVLLVYVVWSNWHAKPGKNGSPDQPGLQEAVNRSIQFLPYAAAAALCVINTFLTFVRWFLLVRAQNLPFTLKSAVRLGLVGYFFNTFLPGSVGGDLLKATFLAREQERRAVAVATVMVDRAIGLWALITLVALTGSVFWLRGDPAIVGQPYMHLIVRLALGLLAASLLCWALLGVLPERRAQRFSQRLHGIPKIGGTLSELWGAVCLYRAKSRILLIALLMSLVGHTCSVLMFVCVVTAFQPAGGPADMPSLPEHFLLVPVGMAAQGFFPAPGGVGGGELVFGWLYTVVGRPQSTGVLGSLGQRMLAWGLGLIGYIVYLFMKKELPRAKIAETEHG